MRNSSGALSGRAGGQGLSLLFASPDFELDRRSFEAESLANLVHKVALMRKVESLSFVGEHDECRRIGGRLRHIEDLHLLAMRD